jgi:hypothetical protein
MRFQSFSAADRALCAAAAAEGATGPQAKPCQCTVLPVGRSWLWTTGCGSSTARALVATGRLLLERKRSSGKVRHVRMLGLCLVALLAVAAIVAASASAASPEWGQCFEKAGGKYANSNCTTKAAKGKGTFEWRKAAEVAKKKFKGASGEGVLHAKFEFCVRGNEDPACSKEQIEKQEPIILEISVACESQSNVGEASGKDEVKNVVVTFTGCKALGVAPCSNTPNAGEIKVNLLKGKLGFIDKANNEVGLDLTPAKAKGDFAQFTCELGETLLTTTVGVAPNTIHEKAVYAPKGGGDGIISPITPINEMSSTFTQEYKENGEDENVPTKFEGSAPLQVLESFLYNPKEAEYRSSWSKAGEALTNVSTPEEPVEIKS